MWHFLLGLGFLASYNIAAYLREKSIGSRGTLRDDWLLDNRGARWILS